MKYHISISNLSADIEITRIDGEKPDKPTTPEKPIPPIIDKPPVQPPINPPVQPDPKYKQLTDYSADPNEAYRQFMQDPGAILEITEDTHITEFEPHHPRARGIIIRPGASLTMGRDWNTPFPNSIVHIDQDGEVNFGIIGNLLLPPNRPRKMMTGAKAVFTTDHTKHITGTLSYLNSQSPSESHQAWTLAGLVYATTDGSNADYLYIIGKNLTIVGPELQQLKGNAGPGLYSILDNITHINPIYKAPRSHHFAADTYLITGAIQDGQFQIVSDNTFSQVANFYGDYHNGNIRTLLQIDRFIFDIAGSRITDDQIFDLQLPEVGQQLDCIVRDGKVYSDAELQPGDITSIGKVFSKNISHEHATWVFEFHYSMEGIPADTTKLTLIERSFDLQEAHPAYLVYKGNWTISNGGVTKATPLGDAEVLMSPGWGWSQYNWSNVNLWWRNFRSPIAGHKKPGFIRISINQGKELARHISLIDCKDINGELKVDYQANTCLGIQMENKLPMPKPAAEAIAFLEAL